MSTPQADGPKDDKAGLSRRSMLGAMAAGSAGAVVGTAAPASAAARPGQGTPRRPLLPVHASQPRGTVLTLLGTSGGPPPDYVRTGTSSVLTVAGHNYVVDAGRSSVTQYLNAGLLFKRLQGIFITHLHADHLADYYNYFLLGGMKNSSGDQLSGPPAVYGPGSAGALPPANGVTTIAPQDPTPGLSDLTAKLTEAFAYSSNIFIREDNGTPITHWTSDVNDIVIPSNVPASALGDVAPNMSPFEVYQDNRVSVSAILVDHGLVFPSFAYRFDTDHGSVVFSGDTRVCDNIVTLAKGADVLVHEVLDYLFYALRGAPPKLLEHFRDAHTFSNQVGAVAERAGVETLVLTHLDPSNPAQFPDARYFRKASRNFSGKVIVGNDFDRIPLRSPRRRRTARGGAKGPRR